MCSIFIRDCSGENDHPTLPDYWKSVTIDPPNGKGVEDYMYEKNPTPDNPSAMWSKYIDCKRLIYVDGSSQNKRYILGCYSMDCCWEEQEGNQVQFQIPNVQIKGEDVSVAYLRTNITNFGNEIEVDEWSWSWGQETWWAYTNYCDSCFNKVELLQWKAQVGKGAAATIQFKGFSGIDPNSDEGQTFKKSFAIPTECKANNLLKCPSS